MKSNQPLYVARLTPLVLKCGDYSWPPWCWSVVTIADPLVLKCGDYRLTPLLLNRGDYS